MILIAENIHIMSKSLGSVLRERDAPALTSIVDSLEKSGADMLDLNIGPARKDGQELMKWMVITIQGASSLPLSLDTTNALAIECGLLHASRPALINSISLQPDRLENLLPLVNAYQAEMIGLLWGLEGMPRDANERAMLAVDLIYQAGQATIPAEKIWIDPILTPVTVDNTQIRACLEFMAMLADISPQCKSVVGLSNVSSGIPSALRPVVNRTCLAMLMKYNLYAAICDTLDSQLVSLARGEKPDIVRLVHDMMDGYSPDPLALDAKLLPYYKTYRVLSGQTQYSDSWLEL
jgi:cobalamin-dependent methionine synthase I